MNFESLYGQDVYKEKAQQRFDALAKKFLDGEGKECERIYSSSGRAEILGNHTDHNHGKVLVAAISCDIIACVSKAENIIVKSEGLTTANTMQIQDIVTNESGIDLSKIKIIPTK